MTTDPESELLSEGLSTAEHQNISNTVEMLLHLERLKNSGMSPEAVADAMTSSRFQPPGGGEWTAETVAKVTGLVGSAAGQRSPQQLRSVPEAPTPAGATLQRLPEAHRDSPLSAQRSVPGEPSVPVGLGGGSALAQRTGDTGRYSPQGEIGPLPSQDEPSPFSGPRILAVAILGLIGLAIGAFVVVALTDESGQEAASADDDAVQGEPSADDGASGDGATQTTIEGFPGVPATDETTDPADMMSIQVDPQPADDSGDGSEIPRATATIKADGLLHLEGAFPTQEDADGYINGLAEVFGRDNIVESYSIDPAAPLPTVSDVSLDKPVLFETGTAIIDPSYIPFLEACGDVLKLNPQITMSITAFTDSVGSDEFNLELSQQRAQAIYDFYRDLDIDETQLLSFGYGEADPVGDNSTEEGREQNRRAMLQLLDVIADESESE